jgi:hypothetical protein
MKIDDFIKQELIASFQKQYKKNDVFPHLESDTDRIIDFIVKEFSPKSATITFNPIDNFSFVAILYDGKILYMYIQFYNNKKTTVKIVSTDGKKEKTVFKGNIDEFIDLYRKK